MASFTDPDVVAPRAAMSRRGFLAAVAAVGLAGPLVACGTTRGGAGADTISWANFTLNLDYDGAIRTYPTLADFEKESAYTGDYREDIEDNVSFNGKVPHNFGMVRASATTS